MILGDPISFQHPNGMTQVKDPSSMTIQKIFIPCDSTLIRKEICDGILLIDYPKSKVIKLVSFGSTAPMAYNSAFL